MVVCCFSKVEHFISLTGLLNAAIFFFLFIKYIFHLLGLPKHILSDRGVQYTGTFKIWQAICKLLEVKLDLLSAYQHQSRDHTEKLCLIWAGQLGKSVSMARVCLQQSHQRVHPSFVKTTSHSAFFILHVFRGSSS